MASLRKNWLQFLTEDEVKKIDAASRRVLIETGIKLEDQELTQKLLDQGCRHEKPAHTIHG